MKYSYYFKQFIEMMRIARLKNLAFTLIELLVVITIVGLIMLTAFYTLGRSSQQVKLQMSVEQAASNLRFEQTQVKSGVFDSQPVCRGYTFANGGSYTPVYSDYLGAALGCSSTLVSSQQFFHAGGVNLESIVPEGAASSISSVTILFEPPTGLVQLLDNSLNDLPNPSVDLTFSYTSADYPVDGILTVNKSGQINYKYQ